MDMLAPSLKLLICSKRYVASAGKHAPRLPLNSSTKNISTHDWSTVMNITSRPIAVGIVPTGLGSILTFCVCSRIWMLWDIRPR